jgi:hypothetical protein
MGKFLIGKKANNNAVENHPLSKKYKNKVSKRRLLKQQIA